MAGKRVLGRRQMCPYRTVYYFEFVFWHLLHMLDIKKHVRIILLVLPFDIFYFFVHKRNDDKHVPAFIFVFSIIYMFQREEECR